MTTLYLILSVRTIHVFFLFYCMCDLIRVPPVDRIFISHICLCGSAPSPLYVAVLHPYLACVHPAPCVVCGESVTWELPSLSKCSHNSFPPAAKSKGLGIIEMSEVEEVGVFGPKVGLYDPAYEKDACGVGIVANLSGEPSHEVRSDTFSDVCFFV